MGKVTQWLLAPTVGFLAAAGVAAAAFGLGKLTYYAATRCTPQRIAPDYYDCWWNLRRVLLAVIENFGMALTVFAFATIIPLLAPDRKPLVAKLSALVGLSFGVYLSMDSGSAVPLIFAILGSLCVVLWAHRRYPRAHVA